MDKKSKITITSVFGSVSWESEKETLREAVIEKHKRDANLLDANLLDANLLGANLKNLPIDYINQCSRDMLFIFEKLKSELPFLREKLVAGEVDGTKYEGDCACLIGTLANQKRGNGDRVEKTCSAIPFYEKGTHNAGEAWFLNIRKGDTLEDNQFAAHALMLMDHVLEGKPIKVL